MNRQTVTVRLPPPTVPRFHGSTVPTVPTVQPWNRGAKPWATVPRSTVGTVGTVNRGNRAYAGMGAHYNTFQLKGKQEDSIGQNRSIIVLDHLQLVIPYLAATYLMLLEMSEQPKWLGLSFRNGFKQALGQSRDFLTICMLQLNLTNAPNTCSIFQQCCPLAANARYKTMHNTTATTVLSQENTPH